MFFIITHIIKHTFNRLMKPMTKTFSIELDRTCIETLVQYQSAESAFLPAKAVQIVHRTTNESQHAPQISLQLPFSPHIWGIILGNYANSRDLRDNQTILGSLSDKWRSYMFNNGCAQRQLLRLKTNSLTFFRTPRKKHKLLEKIRFLRSYDSNLGVWKTKLTILRITLKLIK